ncbi:MAG: YicC/YloC family endoribonuclease [Desulfobacca sp.]|uniref:YicC/YloC family endoribonuclease n=1 Tax=Desulfobacca sp. TaxID=2067990 RepID=UPI00404B1D94
MKSMTAFGRGEAEEGGCRVAVEVRTLNHRFLDLHLRLPRALLALEDRLRQLISSRIARGRVELSVSLTYTGRSPRSLVADVHLLQEAAALLNELQETFALPEPWGWEQLLRFPEVITVQEASANDLEALWSVLSAASRQALEVVEAMRRREGDYLRGELLTHLQRVAAQVEAIAEQAATVPEIYREKLQTRLAQLLPATAPLDPQRLAQEVAILADRADITEELARLRSHLEQFQQAMAVAGPSGRKLDFLLQEMNREINTIGSKAIDADISQAVIAVKTDLERLREQVQNIE